MKELLTKATAVSAKLLAKTKAHSPEILVGVGIVGVIAGTILACNATLRAEEVIDDFEQAKADMEEAKDISANTTTESGEPIYSDEEVKRDTFIIYLRAAKGFAKVYGPAFLVLGSSLACILWGFGILKGRHAAMISAYSALDQSYRKYRDKVKDTLGEEKDKEFLYGLKDIKSEKIIEDENGKKKKVKETEKQITKDPKDISPYCRFFDETSLEYTSDPFYNKNFLMTQQNYWNDKLHTQGYVFLNPVLRSLGMREIFPFGQMVGWKKGLGDNYIDFGLFDSTSEKVRDFINGYEPAILLNFNCDGVIYDKI